MLNIKLIQQLRAMTAASLNDCKTALEEAENDLDKAVEIIKIKGANIISNRSHKIATEGTIAINYNHQLDSAVMVELNCQTDFVARSPEFLALAHQISEDLLTNNNVNQELLNSLIASTKENIIVRRTWKQQTLNANTRVFNYLHANRQIGVLLLLSTGLETITLDPRFRELGENLAMQVAAMNPLAISKEKLTTETIEQQKSIFNTQIDQLQLGDTLDTVMTKQQQDTILNGKMNKWFSEVCLMEQASIINPKLSVRQEISTLEQSMGGKIEVVNFIRFQVGEGLETQQENLQDEVAKLMV